MDPYFLELYKDPQKIPDAFSNLSGASNYNPLNDTEYFAVLIAAPPSGSERADYIAPSPPDATVGTWTHGTDTLAAGTVSFAADKVGIWAPRTKAIPYRFDVYAPDGTHIVLEPVAGDDEHAWFCADVPDTVGNAIGVWRVIVGLKAAARLPAVFPPRRAALNPDDLAFPPVEFERQPLLLIKGPRPRCSNLRSIAVTVGCAGPNQSVTFTADVVNPQYVAEWNWDFGDGTTSEPDAGSVVTHTYATPPTAPVSLTIVREAGCAPLTQTEFVEVTPCYCPTLTGIEIVSGCAPGTIRFRALGENLDAAEEFLWNFGDGATETSPGPEASHDYPEAPADPASVTVSVAIVTPDSCPPSAPQSRAVQLCCPRLGGVLVESGCAPGTVAFRAYGQNLGAATRFHWIFGDGTSMDTDVPEASHPYTEAPPGPGTVYTSVTMVSPAGCPLSAPQRVQVPGCPVTCPQILGIRIVSENTCAPGTVKFQADVDHPEQVEEWNWLFGDGGSSQDAVTTEHTYTSAGPFQASVSIRRHYRCRPIDDGPRYTTVSPCPEEEEEKEQPPQFTWCLLLMLGGLVSLLAGMIFLTIGVAAMAAVVCFFWLASWLIPTGVGPFIVWIVWMVLFVGGVVGGVVFITIGIVMLVTWLFICGGCDGLKSPVSVCEMLKQFMKWIEFLGAATAFVETIILALSGIGAVVCGVGWASWMVLFDAAMWCVDMGALWLLFMGTDYLANAIGCINTTPNSWPYSALQIHLPPPGSNDLPCFDADTMK